MSKKPLPASVEEYLVKTLGRPVEDVVAHRIVNGEETKYAVLLKDMGLVCFVGNYSARRPLGPYEEAHSGNAVRDSWDCLYDGETWEHSVPRFKNAPYDLF